MPVWNPTQIIKSFSALGSGGRNVAGTSFTVSATRDAFVSYSISTSSSLTLTGGTTGTGFLEISPDNSSWTTIAETSNTFSGTVLVGIAITSAQIGIVAGIVPANYFVRIRNTGTLSFVCGQEVLL